MMLPLARSITKLPDDRSSALSHVSVLPAVILDVVEFAEQHRRCNHFDVVLPEIERLEIGDVKHSARIGNHKERGVVFHERFERRETALKPRPSALCYALEVSRVLRLLFDEVPYRHDALVEVLPLARNSCCEDDRRDLYETIEFTLGARLG